MSFDLIETEIANSTQPTILILDSEFTSRAILEQVVRHIHTDITVQSFAHPSEAMAWLKNNQPDLMMIDYMMEGMAGIEIIQQARSIPHLENVPAIVITAAEEKSIRYLALDAGANDFIIKPIDAHECRVRCRNLLAMRLHQKAAQNHAAHLEVAVSIATGHVRNREHETLFRLAKAGEYRDTVTGNHILRMSNYSRLIAESLGMNQDYCELIEKASPMHDIGKIGISDYILRKPGKLNPDEMDVMKTHSSIGFQILQSSQSKYISIAAEIALGHHEKFDGSGYPQGLSGQQIPMESRIVAVADVYDALTSVRPYKSAWSNKEALEYLTANKGAHFDPDCVNAFIAQYDRVMQIQQRLRDYTDTGAVQTSQ